MQDLYHQRYCHCRCSPLQHMTGAPVDLHRAYSPSKAQRKVQALVQSPQRKLAKQFRCKPHSTTRICCPAAGVRRSRPPSGCTAAGRGSRRAWETSIWMGRRPTAHFRCTTRYWTQHASTIFDWTGPEDASCKGPAATLLPKSNTLAESVVVPQPVIELHDVQGSLLLRKTGFQGTAAEFGD